MDRLMDKMPPDGQMDELPNPKQIAGQKDSQIDWQEKERADRQLDRIIEQAGLSRATLKISTRIPYEFPLWNTGPGSQEH